MALRSKLKQQLAGKSLPHPVKFGDWDNAKNTTPDGKQVWLWISDSTPITNQGTDTAPEVFYANTVYYWNTGSSNIVAVTNTDITTIATAGTMHVKWGIDNYKRTGNKTVWVTANVGGSNFYPDGDSNNWYDYVVQFGQAVTDTKNALAFLGLVNVRGVIIQCGINDARATQDLGAIEYSIMNLVDRINNRLNTPNIHFVNVGRDENGTGRDQRVLAVDSYIKRACDYFSNCYEVLRISDFISDPFVYSNSFSDVHMTQFGMDFCAAKMVRNMVSLGLLVDRPREYTWSTDFLTVMANMANPHLISYEEKQAMADYIDYMTSKGNWSAKKDCFYVPLFKDEGNSRSDWRRLNKPITGGQWLLNRGGIRTSGDGSTMSGRIHTGFTPSVDGVNYVQNNAAVGCYLLLNKDTTGADRYIFGSQGGGHITHLIWSNTNTDKRFIMNSSSNGTSATGFFINAQWLMVTRAAAGTDNIIINFSSSPHAFASSGLPTAELVFGARNNAGVFSGGYKGHYGLLTVGAAPTSNLEEYKKNRELVVDFLAMRE